MRFTVSSKIFVAILATEVALLGIVLGLLYFYGADFLSFMRTTNNTTISIAVDGAKRAMEQTGELSVTEVSQNTARALSAYLAARPRADASELAHDPVFAQIATHEIFEHGYIMVVVPGTHFVVAHPLSKFVGKRIEETEGIDPLLVAALAREFDAMGESDGVSGIFPFPQTGGGTSQKFLSATEIRGFTKDGERLFVIAVANVADFDHETNALASLLRQRNGEIVGEMSALRESLVSALSLDLLLLLLVAVGIALVFSRTLGRSLSSLTKACEHITEGRFDIPMPTTHGHDEVERLAESIETMRINLQRQTDLILQQTRDAAERQRDLEEALAIAELRAKQRLAELCGGES